MTGCRRVHSGIVCETRQNGIRRDDHLWTAVVLLNKDYYKIQLVSRPEPSETHHGMLNVVVPWS